MRHFTKIMEHKPSTTPRFSWIVILITLGLAPVTHAMTTEATSSEENKHIADETQSFLHDFPQSALSLLGLGLFIITSMLIATCSERLYERMSIRGDSSDMSETTKNILRAHVLGMVFKKPGPNLMEIKDDEQRAKALVNKYVERWRFNTKRMKQRKKRQSVAAIEQENEKGSMFRRFKTRVSKFFWSKKDPLKSVEESEPEKSKSESVTEKPSHDESQSVQPDRKQSVKMNGAAHKSKAPQSKDNSPAKQKNNTSQQSTPKKVAGGGAKGSQPSKAKPSKIARSQTKADFVAVDLKFATENSTEEQNKPSDSTEIEMPVTSKDKQDQSPNESLRLQNTSFEDEEFAIDMNPAQTNRSNKSNSSLFKTPRNKSKDSFTQSETESVSQKYVRAETPKVPLNKKLKSLRPLTAGKSRQIQPGGATRTDNSENYKQQGNSVRSELIKNLGLSLSKR